MSKFETCRSYPGVRRKVGDKSWSFRLRINGQDHAGYGYKTAKAAYEAREKMSADLKSKGFSNVLVKKTFTDVYNEFVNDKSLNRAVSTMTRYDADFRNHLKPMFGNKQIKAITTADLENFFIQIGQEQPDKKFGKMQIYSWSTIDGMRKLLQNIFKQALKSNYICINPMAYVSKDLLRGIGVPKEEGRYITDDELAKIDDRLKGLNTYTAFRIAIATGLRLGEVFGLLWTDIDFENRTISVERQLISVVKDDSVTWCFAPLKTAAAYRTVSFNEELYIFLLCMKAKQEEQQAKLGDRYVTNNVGLLNGPDSIEMINKDLPLVNRRFLSGRYGEMMTPSSWKRANRVIRDELKIEGATFHDFRHTHCCNCADAGMDIYSLQKRLGHEKIETLYSYYRHETPFMKERELRVLNSMSISNIDEVRAREATQTDMKEDFYHDIPNNGYRDEPLTSAELLGGKFAPYKNGFIKSR